MHGIKTKGRLRYGLEAMAFGGLCSRPPVSFNRRRRRPDRELQPGHGGPAENPEPGNWMHYRRTYDGQGYSPLDQINTSNVKNLMPVWTFSTGVVEGHEAPPIINNGVMFIATPSGQVIALNAKTGDEYWRYKRQLPDDLFQLHPTNRGVGLWQDKVYLATTDDHLVALDAKTGKVVWDTKVQDYKKGQYLTLMPLVVDGKVIVGGSGGEFGVRGYVVAFDADSGKELWRTFTIPGPGRARPRNVERRRLEIGRRAGLDDRQLRYRNQDDLLGHRQCRAVAGRGASRRQSLFLVGARARSRQRQDEVALPVPSEQFLGLGRGGRADAGRPAKRRPHHQEPDPSRTRRASSGCWSARRKASNTSRAGRSFIPMSGRASSRPAGRSSIPRTSRGSASGSSSVRRCGAARIGRRRPISQKTGLVYVPANENFCGGFTGEKVPLVPGQLWLGTKPEDIGLTPRPGATHFGELQAWDPVTGKKAWSAQFPEIAVVRFGDGDRGRSRSGRRHQRPDVPRLPCQDRRTAVGAEDQLRHHGHADRL